MSKILRMYGLFYPAALGLALILPIKGLALESIDAASSTPETSPIDTQPSNTDLGNPSDLLLADAATPSVSELMETTQDNSLEQVTSVSQLSDVQPDDWAFQAIQSLVERYGCVAGYPNGTFRPNRAMSRREAAALVNACLDNLSNRFATKEDLDALKALQDEFAAELATLRGRVDGLEARVATVESQQFSTTTKLKGEVIFGSGYAIDRGGADLTGPGGTFEEDRFFLAQRTRLNFDTSFSGSDRLRVRFDINTVPNLGNATNSNMSRLSFDGRGNTNVVLTELNYQFKPVDNLKIKIDANAGEYQDNVDTLNPYLASSGSGALSRFGRFSPIYRQGGSGIGVTANWDITENVELSLGYLADEGENAVGAGDDIAAPTGGLIGGSYAALAQLVFKPIENAKIGLTYVRSFDEAGNVNVTSSTTSNNRRPFGNALDTSADHLGFQTTFQAADWVNFSGWVGYTFARTSQANATDDQKAEYLTWAGSLQFPDLGFEGNLGYILFGQPYKVQNANSTLINGVPGVLANPDDANPGTSYHLEAGYKFKVNDNIHITPGVIWIINPENNNLNSDVVVPLVRTTFKF